MNIDAHAYNITIRRGTFEGDVLFEARVRELPDLIEYGETYGEAYDLAIDAIETTAEVLAGKGRSMPAPSVPAEDFSGRVTLRLPKSLHRALSEAADAEDVSLNQHLVSVLACFSGFAARDRGYEEPAWEPFGPAAPSADRGKTRTPLRVVRSSPIDQQQAAGWH